MSTNVLRKALHHWVTWNSFIELIATYRYRVEEVDFGKICEMGGFGDRCPKGAALQAAIDSVPVTTNSRKKENLGKVKDYAQGAAKDNVTWEKLFAEDHKMASLAYGMALDYGYEVQLDPVYQPAPRRCGFGIGKAAEKRASWETTKFGCTVANRAVPQR
mmetsp:Transcript_3264/g.11844  ORF Transcript_3264/g.11844 Transcript_3264/m.11844 type:complete len:160 (+) Transcript_3264:115-594(+)